MKSESKGTVDVLSSMHKTSELFPIVDGFLGCGLVVEPEVTVPLDIAVWDALARTSPGKVDRQSTRSSLNALTADLPANGFTHV